MSSELLFIWSERPALSLAIWLFLLVTVMYLGRSASHQLLRVAGRSVYHAMRLFARALNSWQASLAARNHRVLLVEGKAQLQRTIEREFVRVQSIIARDLSHYPTLHRQISDTVCKIEQDYDGTVDTPPDPPAWLDVVEAVAKIPRNGDPAVAKILDKIQATLEDAHHETLGAYLESSQKTHKLLGKMQPQWRSVASDLNKIQHSVDGLEDRGAVIDQQMQKYQSMRNEEVDALHSLTSSSLTQFFISGLVLVVAILGGLINYQLIAMPMSEMVGGTSYIGAMRTSDIAALVIILIEIAMGVFLLESLRITHLFPMIGTMDDKLRRRMMIITLTILTILATVEASLAYMRDLLALDRETLKQSLAGASVVEANFRWIPSLGQMVMGFILPFALAFVAIPLESFIHSLRTVIGLIAQGVLRGLAMLARLLGSGATHVCHFLIHCYDLIIMVPLSAERWINQRRQQREGVTSASDTEFLSKERGAES